jgi:hypothetical protein
MQPPPAITPVAAKALEGLADIETPPPVAWTPQTWGWIALAAILLALAAWTLWRLHRSREANRYRVEALAALTPLAPLLWQPERRGEALGAVGEVLKRTALAAFPRSEVAGLSGPTWTAFLRRHAPDDLAPAAVTLLDDLEYRGPSALGAMSSSDALAAFEAARRWIERHRVRA